MNKKFYLFVLIFSFLVVTLSNIGLGLKAKGNNVLLNIQNIEALASGEDSTPTVSCLGGSYKCATVTDSSGVPRTYYKGN